MRKIIIITIITILALTFCVSCKSLEPEPIDLDITLQLNTVFETRPDNSQFMFMVDPLYNWQYAQNAETFFLAWSLWQNYAESLEKTLVAIEASLKPSV
jgi:hypothetical protein